MAPARALRRGGERPTAKVYLISKKKSGDDEKETWSELCGAFETASGFVFTLDAVPGSLLRGEPARIIIKRNR